MAEIRRAWDVASVLIGPKVTIAACSVENTSLEEMFPGNSGKIGCLQRTAMMDAVSEFLCQRMSDRGIRRILGYARAGIDEIPTPFLAGS